MQEQNAITSEIKHLGRNEVKHPFICGDRNVRSYASKLTCFENEINDW